MSVSLAVALYCKVGESQTHTKFLLLIQKEMRLEHTHGLTDLTITYQGEHLSRTILQGIVKCNWPKNNQSNIIDCI